MAGRIRANRNYRAGIKSMTDTQHLTAEFEELVYQAQMANDSESCEHYMKAIEKQKLKRQGKNNKAN